nr:reverse transcriptase domain-containing protein [Tanacetum cinerariifolium]
MCTQVWKQQECNYHHIGQCAPKCGNSKRYGHPTNDCRVNTNNNNNNKKNQKAGACYECGDTEHIKKNCPKLKNHGNGNGNGVAQGRAYALGGRDASPDSNVITGTFLLNNRYAAIFFDTGTDMSFVSTTFSAIDITPTTLENHYDVEFADRKIIGVNTIIRGCTLNFMNHPFNIDLIPVPLGSFNVIIGMDWLTKYHGVIICEEKIVRVPFGREMLIFQGNENNQREESRLNIISCTKAQEYLSKGSRVYTAGPGEKKVYIGDLPLCTKCNYHHTGQCVPKCRKCKSGNGVAQGRVYALGGRDASPDSNVITETHYDVELAAGKIIGVNTIICGCTLNFMNHPFNIDLMPVPLGSFDVIIGMDWLTKYHRVIICDEKIVRVPFGREILIFQGNGDNQIEESRLNIISCTKAQEYLSKGCDVFLAHVTTKEAKDKLEGKRIEDVPIVRDFLKVFPEDLPGIPPARPVEFQIDLVLGAVPVARAPYRLAPSEMKELAKQLQELFDKGFM